MRWAAVTRLILPFLACAALAACSNSGPVAKDAKNTVSVAATNKPKPSANASGGPPVSQTEPETVPAGAASQAVPDLPAAVRGRWGMTPGDCTSTRGDAKGLLIIAADGLKFYESRAVPTGDVQSDANSAAGTFNFTGEGQSWTRYEALNVQGNMLTRTESNPTASFTYAKCS